MENVRVALVHDWLTGRRGGEKVLEVLAEIFPQAPIYTLFHFPGSQIPEIERRTIRTSFVQGLPFLRRHYRRYLPLFPLAAELFDLQEYDLVVSSSHCTAKGVIPSPGALHISYVHSPVRYAWNQYFAYFGPGKLGFPSKFIVPSMIHRLRIWDVASSARVDRFIANSKSVAGRIEKYYRRTAEVIHPPVDTDFFQPPASEPDRKYFLVVTALVPYKRIDLAVAACNLKRYSLKVVGDGPEYKVLKAAAGPTVEFLGSVEGSELRGLFQEAIALLMPGEEDFGIGAVEAQASGTPVIALGRGGALETVRPGETGLYFNEPTPAGLGTALDKCRSMTFNKASLRAHALAFSRGVFRERIETRLAALWREFKDPR